MFRSSSDGDNTANTYQPEPGFRHSDFDHGELAGIFLFKHTVFLSRAATPISVFLDPFEAGHVHLALRSSQLT